MKKIINILPLVALLFAACNKKNCKESNPELVNSSNSSNTQSYRTTSPTTYLTFANKEAFHLKLAEVQLLDSSALQVWESQRDFFSMRNAFNELTTAELKVSKRIDNMSQDSLDYYDTKPTLHSQEATDYAHMIFTRSEGNGSFFDLNINNYNLAYLVNTYGIVKIGDKIYQFTKDYVKSINNGDQNKISTLLMATENDPTNNITVTAFSTGIDPFLRQASTSTFVRSSIGNSGRDRVIVYQNWDQNNTSISDTKVTTYKVRIRSLVRRLRGAWYDNCCRFLSVSANVQGSNGLQGKNASGTNITVNYTFSNSNSTAQKEHTWDYFLPANQGMVQSNPGFVTIGNSNHPTITSSSIVGNAGGVSATTTFP